MEYKDLWMALDAARERLAPWMDRISLVHSNFCELDAILDGLGGKENIVSFEHCITRLRLLVKDYTAVDEKKIRAAGVAGVMRPSKTRVDVIVGTKVGFVADELAKLL